MGKVIQKTANTFQLISKVGNITREVLPTLEVSNDFIDLSDLNEEIKAIAIPSGKLLEVGLHVTLRFSDIDGQKIQREDPNIKFVKDRLRESGTRGV